MTKINQIVAAADATDMTKLLVSWYRTSARTTPTAVEFPDFEAVVAPLAGYDSKQLLRLAGFLQSVGKIYHAEVEMTPDEKKTATAELTAKRTAALEEANERNLTQRQRNERETRELLATPKVGLAVYAPDIDGENNYTLFAGHIVSLPEGQVETYVVKWVDADAPEAETEVPFVVCASDRAHKAEAFRVPTDAQCDVLDVWYADAQVEVAPAPVVKKGPKAKPVAVDADLLSDADLLADEAPVVTTKGPKLAKAKAVTKVAAQTKPSVAKVAAKPVTKPAATGPAKRVKA